MYKIYECLVHGMVLVYFLLVAALLSFVFFSGKVIASEKINEVHFSKGEGDEKSSRVIDFYTNYCVNKGEGGGYTNYAEYCVTSRHTINCGSCHEKY